MRSRNAQAAYFFASTMREAPKCGRIYYCSPSILASRHWLVKHAVESENAEHMEKVQERQHFSHVSHVKTLDGTGKICLDSRLELALLAHQTVWCPICSYMWEVVLLLAAKENGFLKSFMCKRYSQLCRVKAHRITGTFWNVCRV